MEVVRDGFCFRNEQWLHAFRFHGDHVVLILQDTLDGQKPL